MHETGHNDNRVQGSRLEDGLRTVLVLANPLAGSGPSAGVLEQYVAELKRRGFSVEVCRELAALGETAARHGDDLRCVTAAGGDGTVAEVLNRVPGAPVAILPVGHENLAARYLGSRGGVARLASDTAEAVAAGRVAYFDLGRLNGRWFALMASAGFDADVVHRVHRRRTGHVNKLLYFFHILLAVREYRFPPMQVEIVDTGERLTGALAFAFNMPQYGLGLPIATEADPHDGLLDVWVFERPGVVNLLGYLLAVVCRRQRGRRDVHFRRARMVRWSTALPGRHRHPAAAEMLNRLPEVPGVPGVQVDGDPAGELPASVECLPAAARFVLPAR